MNQISIPALSNLYFKKHVYFFSDLTEHEITGGCPSLDSLHTHFFFSVIRYFDTEPIWCVAAPSQRARDFIFDGMPFTDFNEALGAVT